MSGRICENCEKATDVGCRCMNAHYCDSCVSQGYQNTCNSGVTQVPAPRLKTPKEPTKGMCTYAVTGNRHYKQHWYTCDTCFPGESRTKGDCVYCAFSCKEKGHFVTYVAESAFYCDQRPALNTPKEPTPGECTFQQTGKQFIIQHLYHCNTCFEPDSGNCVCCYCIDSCVKLGHATVYKNRSPFYCEKQGAKIE